MQRVALARALVKRPKVLLLDEPLGALDLKLRIQMQLELKRIQREVGTTFIYVTHDQGEALTMSDRIAVMNNGRIDQLATPQEIYDRPATRFVANFIGNANLLPVDDAKPGRGRRIRPCVSMGGLTFPTSVAQKPTGARAGSRMRYERIRLGEAAARDADPRSGRSARHDLRGLDRALCHEPEPSGIELIVEAGT